MRSGTIFDWNHGDIDIDVDRNIDIDRNVDIDRKKWQHDSHHRRGVKYNNDAVRNKFAKADARPADRKLDYRGRSGEQVLKPDNKPAGGGLKPGGGRFRAGGGDKRPDLGGKGPGKNRMSVKSSGTEENGTGKQANLPGQKPDLGKAKPKAKPGGGNAFDTSDGPKAKDFAKRGQASLGESRRNAESQTARGGGGS